MAMHPMPHFEKLRIGSRRNIGSGYHLHGFVSRHRWVLREMMAVRVVIIVQPSLRLMITQLQCPIGVAIIAFRACAILSRMGAHNLYFRSGVKILWCGSMVLRA